MRRNFLPSSDRNIVQRALALEARKRPLNRLALFGRLNDDPCKDPLLILTTTPQDVRYTPPKIGVGKIKPQPGGVLP